MGYEKSKVYKLQHEDGHFYIGSTINELRVRFQGHRDRSKRESEKNRRVYKHINNEWNKVRIVLVEAFECSNRDELRQKEDEYIQKELKNPLCLNFCRAFLSEEDKKKYKQDYYIQNRETYKIRDARWYREHREYRREYAMRKRKERKEQQREIQEAILPLILSQEEEEE
jgi:hypothetical protein